MKYTSARLHVGTMLLLALVPTFQRAVVYQDPLAVLDRASSSFDTVRTLARSEERRVGKECTEQCRSRWSPYH